jgi:hypothetical protein
MKQEKKIIRLKTSKNNGSSLNIKPLEIQSNCITFIEVYRDCKCNAYWALDYVDAQGRHIYNDESDEYKCKMNLIELDGEDKNIREFFWKRYMKRFEKNQDKICEMCKFYKSYKATGKCEELIYPAKDWKTKYNKV